MKKTALALILLSPGAAHAHVGHLGEMAGHDHVVAGVALGAAVAVAAWGWLKGGKAEESHASDDDEPETDAEEAEA